ncbi:MAG: hypothetical protein Q4E12_06280 [Coriobacteriia bacterium]|nr:hypothetical protein [Coriobacteriia bacterium]
MYEFKPGGEEGTLEFYANGYHEGTVRGVTGYVEGETTAEDVFKQLIDGHATADFEPLDYVGFTMVGSPMVLSWSMPDLRHQVSLRAGE